MVGSFRDFIKTLPVGLKIQIRREEKGWHFSWLPAPTLAWVVYGCVFCRVDSSPDFPYLQLVVTIVSSSLFYIIVYGDKKGTKSKRNNSINKFNKSVIIQEIRKTWIPMNIIAFYLFIFFKQ